MFYGTEYIQKSLKGNEKFEEKNSKFSGSGIENLGSVHGTKT